MVNFYAEDNETMENEEIEENLPTLAKNTNISFSVEGWPATAAISVVSVSTVFAVCFWSYMKYHG